MRVQRGDLRGIVRIGHEKYCRSNRSHDLSCRHVAFTSMSRTYFVHIYIDLVHPLEDFIMVRKKK